MFGKKKTTGTATPVPQVSNKKKIEDCLTSMSFLSHFVIDKKESLVEEEIKTVREIDKVKDSYTDVIEHNASIREAVDSLQKEFGKIGEISGQFTDVITDVTSVSDDAMQDIRDLKESSVKVETSSQRFIKSTMNFRPALMKYMQPCKTLSALQTRPTCWH